MKLRTVLAMVLAVGCGGSEAPPVEEGTRLEEQRVCERFTLTLESGGGDCAGDCYSRIHLTSDGLGYVARADFWDRPEAKFLFALSPEELDAVKGALEESFTQKWEDRYSGAHCADGAASILRYTCDGSQFLETTIPCPVRGPELFRPLIFELWALQRAHAF
ncbi:hypothetical protein ACLESD_39890 [Pyxidicoccus sp. 3LFB2]